MSSSRHNQIDTLVKITSSDFTITSESIPCKFSKHFIAIGIYTDAECIELWAPASGTADIKATDDGLQWGNIQKEAITLNDPEYIRPSAQGRVSAVKAIISDLDSSCIGKFIRLQLHSYF